MQHWPGLYYYFRCLSHSFCPRNYDWILKVPSFKIKYGMSIFLRVKLVKVVLELTRAKTGMVSVLDIWNQYSIIRLKKKINATNIMACCIKKAFYSVRLKTFDPGSAKYGMSSHIINRTSCQNIIFAFSFPVGCLKAIYWNSSFH